MDRPTPSRSTDATPPNTAVTQARLRAIRDADGDATLPPDPALGLAGFDLPATAPRHRGGRGSA